jgi:O-antigen/teichoic acid export membrane protein
MFKKILGTSATRILHALANLFMLWMATNYMAKESWGLSGIILLDISLILLFADMGGNALVFYSSRRKIFSLLKWSSIWLVFIILLTSSIFLFLSFSPKLFYLIVPEGYAVHILLLVLLNSLNGFALNILLGKEKLKAFNLLFTLQFVLMITVMAINIFWFDISDERSFVIALYISFSISAILSNILVINLAIKEESQASTSLKELLIYGIITQFSSITHLLNKRLGFYFIKNISGLGALGIYHSGAQVTEGLRLIGQSIALVQMSAISNTNDSGYAKIITLQLLKVSVLITLIGVITLSILPSEFFTYVFSKDYGDIKTVIIFLGPGVVALAANAVFSHYFSGTGVPRYNLYASLIGFVVTLPTVYFLVPTYGIIGAAVSSSLAYFAAVIYQWIIFKQINNLTFFDLLITRSDLILFKLLFKQFITNRK